MRAFQEVASPCTGLCELDQQRICIGCGRSIDEIIAWRSLSAKEKQKVVAAAAQRKAASDQIDD